MKTFLLSAAVVFMILASSCGDEKGAIVDVNPYHWKESSLSPNNLFTFGRFEIGDDGYLYACGTSPMSGQTGIFKYPGPNWNAGNTWTNIGEPGLNEFSNLHSFNIYQGSIYFHAFNKLYKIEGTEAKEILSSDLITSIERCQDKLIIIGENIDVSNDNFTIVSYDGSTFEPLSKENMLSTIIAANDKVFIPGFPSLSYDGERLTPLSFYGYFFAVDGEEQIYYSNSSEDKFFLSRQSNFGEEEPVGNFIEGMGAIFHSLEFFDGTVFVIGVDILNDFTRVYFLKDDKWIQVLTEHTIYDVIVFENRLIAFSIDGKIYELVKD